MYLFIIYIFVYFIHEADLKHVPRTVLDGAADTARLIDLVQRIVNFEDRYPTKNSNDGTIDKDADDLKYEAMKLLQKNYDVARKFNVVDAGTNVQYIVNPEVIAAYRSIPEEHTEEYDDISDQATQRSYARELENIEKLPIHEMRSSRRNKHKTAKTSTSDETDNDNGKSRKDNSNDADEDTKVYDNQRTNVEDGDTVKVDTKENDSKATKQSHEKSAETFNILKPLIKEMLSKYSVKVSQEKEESVEAKGKDVSIIEKRNENEDNFEKPPNKKKQEESKKNIDALREKENELDAPKKKKGAERLSSKKKKKDKKENISHKKHSGQKRIRQADRDLTKENDSVSEKKISNPIITIEDNKSEETQGGLNDENKKEQTIEFKNKLKSKKHMKHENMNSDSKQKTEKIKSKEINSKENEKKKTFIKMEETVINWEDYDEDNEADAQDSGISEEDKSSKNNKNKGKSKKHDKHTGSKKISTKRKGDDNWDDKFDNGDNNESRKNKKQDWAKTEDDNWDKKDKPKKKDRDWSKDDKSKDDDWNKKDNKNKKDDSWNKKNDDGDLNKKKDNWKKKDDDWDIKDNNWDTKEDIKVEKKNKVDKIVDTRYDKTPKKDNTWDNVGTDKKQNTGWGNYDSFKNIKDKTSNNEEYSRQEKWVPPKVEIRPPKYQSWDRPAARDEYYEKPRKKQGRPHSSGLGTSIPFVGKKAVYAD